MVNCDMILLRAIPTVKAVPLIESVLRAEVLLT